MKQIFLNLFFILALTACKVDNSQKNQLTLDKDSLKSTAIKNDSIQPIKIFNIVYDSVQEYDSGQLPLLLKNLDFSFKDYSLVKDQEYIDSRLHAYQDRRFAKSLMSDFDNENFTKTSYINVAFLTEKQSKINRNIRVEEWFFNEEATAISCLESLKSYREREIHFKFISWIWVRQKNKLFLIFTTDYMVDSKPMQTVKSHLLATINKVEKEYDILEMD